VAKAAEAERKAEEEREVARLQLKVP